MSVPVPLCVSWCQITEDLARCPWRDPLSSLDDIDADDDDTQPVANNSNIEDDDSGGGDDDRERPAHVYGDDPTAVTASLLLLESLKVRQRYRIFPATTTTTTTTPPSCS